MCFKLSLLHGIRGILLGEETGPTRREQRDRIAEVREENQHKYNICENAIINPITSDVSFKT